jgi:uncharacterized protein YkwD
MKTNIQTVSDNSVSANASGRSLVLPSDWFSKSGEAVQRFGVWARDHFLPTHTNGFYPHFHRSKHVGLYLVAMIALKLVEIGTLVSEPAQAAVAVGTLSEQRQEVISQTNAIRIGQGLNEVSLNASLNASAQAKAEDMATKQYFGHAGPDGRRLAYWLSTVGYSYKLAGENLATGFSSGSAAMQGWINSPTHYANIIESQYTEFGVGIASGTFEGEQTVFIVQHFGAPKVAVAPAPAPVSQPVVTQPTTQPKQVTPIYATIPAAVASPDDLSGMQKVTVQKTKAVVDYDASQSKVGWDEQGDTVTIAAMAKISGPVDSVTVEVSGLTFDLGYREEVDSYVGYVNAPAGSTEVSSALTVPTITIKSQSGQVLTDSIDWAGVKTLAQPATNEYLKAATDVTAEWPIIKTLRAITLGGLAALAMTLGIQAYFALRNRKPILGAEMTATAVVILTLVVL